MTGRSSEHIQGLFLDETDYEKNKRKPFSLMREIRARCDQSTPGLDGIRETETLYFCLSYARKISGWKSSHVS